MQEYVAPFPAGKKMTEFAASGAAEAMAGTIVIVSIATVAVATINSILLVRPTLHSSRLLACCGFRGTVSRRQGTLVP